MVAPFSGARDRLVTIPGIGQAVAETVLAECGPTWECSHRGHLASWAGLCPATTSPPASTAQARPARETPGLGDALTQAAWSAARTDTFLGARFRRLSRRLGNKKAIVAVAHSILIAIWHVLAEDCDYTDLGSDWYDAWDPTARLARWSASSKPSATTSTSAQLPEPNLNNADVG